MRTGSHLSKWPNLNLVLYVSPKQHIPLSIRREDNTKAESFINAHWGGVIIFNANFSKDEKLPVRVNVENPQIMLTFIKHLRILLDFEDTKQTTADGIKFLPHDCLSMTKWVSRNCFIGISPLSLFLFY